MGEAEPVPPLAVGSIPVTPVVNGRFVPFIKLIDDGVPPAPPLTTGDPAVPILTPSAFATFDPRPETPVEIGSPVAFVRVPLTGVPKTGAVSVGDEIVGEIDRTRLPVPDDANSPKTPALLYSIAPFDPPVITVVPTVTLAEGVVVVASVPLVGSVSDVEPVIVRTSGYAPVSVNAPWVRAFPPRVSVFDPLFTPVPPCPDGTNAPPPVDGSVNTG